MQASAHYYNYLDDESLSEMNLPDEQVLINKLLKYYDPAARPVFNASNPVVIKFSFALIQLCDMDERNQILTTNVWLEQVSHSSYKGQSVRLKLI